MVLVRIAGQPLPNPSEIERGEFRITKSERTADGTMVMDVIAVKRKVTLSWDFLADADYAAVKVLFSGQTFVTVEFPDPTGQVTMTAYPGDITDRAWQTRNGVRWWQGVQIPLIER